MSTQLPNVSNNTQKIVEDIQALQKMEQQMFSSLENNPNLSETQKQKIVKKIKKLSEMRISLYQTMGGVNQFFKNALLSSQGALQEQTIAINMIESELNETKQRLDMLMQEKNNKLRLVEINTYYGDQYAEHTGIMKILVITLIPIIILAILNSKGIIPTNIYYILVGIIAVIGGYFFVNIFLSIISRDNMNYQQYDWAFDASYAPTTSVLDGSKNAVNPWSTPVTLGCSNSSCCAAGTKWDSSANTCTVGTENFTTGSDNYITEGMISDILTQTSTSNRYKQNNNSNFKPNYSDSFINYK